VIVPGTDSAPKRPPSGKSEPSESDPPPGEVGESGRSG
jgi:hypothetical protein